MDLVRGRRFSLAKPLPSISSVASGAPPALFGDFAGTMGLSDFPDSCIAVVPLSVHGAGLSANPSRTRDLPASEPKAWPSLVRCLCACMGSQTPRSPDGSCDDDPPGVAFRRTQAVGTPDRIFEARYPARTYPGSTGSPPAVNASTVSSRIPPHDSEPMWLAMPSSYETLIHNTSPALAGARVPVSVPLPQFR